MRKWRNANLAAPQKFLLLRLSRKTAMHLKVAQFERGDATRIKLQPRIAPRHPVELSQVIQHLALVMIDRHPRRRSARCIICREQRHWERYLELFLAQRHD